MRRSGITHRRFRHVIFICISILTACISFFVFFGQKILYKASPLFISRSETCRESWKRSFDQIRQCLNKESIRNKNWMTFDQDIQYCSGRQKLISRSMPDLKKESSIDFIPPNDKNMPGTFVTLGITNNLNTELYIHKTWPRWLFYGVDMNEGKRQIYETLGAFHNLTISNSSPTFHLPFPFGRRRRRWMSQTGDIDFIDYISSVIKKFAIDYLLINSRSMAFSILPQLAKPHAIEHGGIAICQVTIHIPRKLVSRVDPDKNEVSEIIKDLVAGNSWLPLKASWTKNEDGQLFLINSASLYCLEKFFSKC